MSISAIYAALSAEAARTGQAASRTLLRGARLTVRVRDGQAILTIARKNNEVGESEIATFCRDCGVPPAAARAPQEGQKRMYHDKELWFYLSFTWSVEERP